MVEDLGGGRMFWDKRGKDRDVEECGGVRKGFYGKILGRF